MAWAGTEGSAIAEISTGIAELTSTFSVLDPSIMRILLLRPCEAMKIRSQPADRAAAMIAVGASLTAVADEQGTPRARAADSALVNNSRARPSKP